MVARSWDGSSHGARNRSSMRAGDGSRGHIAARNEASGDRRLATVEALEDWGRWASIRVSKVACALGVVAVVASTHLQVGHGSESLAYGPGCGFVHQCFSFVGQFDHHKLKQSSDGVVGGVKVFTEHFECIADLFRFLLFTFQVFGRLGGQSGDRRCSASLRRSTQLGIDVSEPGPFVILLLLYCVCGRSRGRWGG